MLLVAFVCVCASSTLAIAAITKGTVGVELIVPTNFENPSDDEQTDPGDYTQGKSSFMGLIGIKLVVPPTIEQELPKDPVTGEPVYGDPTGESNGGYSATAGLIGIKMMVPKTVEDSEPVLDEDGNPVLDDEGNPVTGGNSNGGFTTIPGMVGIHIVIPNVTDEKGELAGETTGISEGATTVPGMLGIHMAVPGNVQMTDENTGIIGPDGEYYATGTPGVIGIHMAVSTGTMVTFDANNGTGEKYQEAVMYGKTVKQPGTDKFDPKWSGRHIEGWYTMANPPKSEEGDAGEGEGESGDADEPAFVMIDNSYRKWKFDGEDDADTVTTAVVLYAKWEIDPVLVHWPVTLYTNYSDAELSDDDRELGITGKFECQQSGIDYADGILYDPDQNPVPGIGDVGLNGYEKDEESKYGGTWVGHYWEGGGYYDSEDPTKGDYDYEDATLTLPTPTLRDHEFQGWYVAKCDEETGDLIVDDKGMPTADFSGNPVSKITRQTKGALSYVALWKSVQTFNVVFDLNNDNLGMDGNAPDPADPIYSGDTAADDIAANQPAPQTVSVGKRATQPANPLNDDNDFVTWAYKNADGTFTEWSFTTPVGIEYVDDPSDDVNGGDRQITLYAMWTKRIFTVYFNSDGGSAVDPAYLKLASGSLVSEPDPSPDKPSNKFIGWRAEKADKLWDFESDTVTSANTSNGILRLQAEYTDPDSYAVIFYKGYPDDFDDGTVTAEHVKLSVLHGKGLTLEEAWPEDPAYDGAHYVEGWYSPTEPVDLPDGQVAVADPEFGNLFKWDSQWVLDTVVPYDDSEGASNLIELYPKWKIKQYTVTYKTRNLQGDLVDHYAETVDHGDNAGGPPRKPLIGGYVFKHWSLEDRGEDAFDFDNTPIVEDVTLYAVFERAEGCVVTFMDGGEVWGEQQTVAKGMTAMYPGAPTPAEDSAEPYFTGWYLDVTPEPTDAEPAPASEYKLYTFTEPVEVDTTLYAQWSDDPGEAILEKVFYVRLYDGCDNAGNGDTSTLGDFNDIVYAGEGSDRKPFELKYGGNLENLLSLFDTVDENGDPAQVKPERMGYNFAGYWGAPESGDPVKYLDFNQTARGWYVSDLFASVIDADGDEKYDFAWTRIDDARDEASLDIKDFDASGNPTGTHRVTGAHVLTLTAKWDARCDATIPMGVMFAVDAATGQTTTPNFSDPDDDAKAVYGIRSRTARELVVESVAFDPDEKGLDDFFEAADGGALSYGGARFWIVTNGADSQLLADGPASPTLVPRADADWAVVLPLKGENAEARKVELTDSKKAVFTVPAFEIYNTGAKYYTGQSTSELRDQDIRDFKTSDLKLKLGLTPGSALRPKFQPDNEQKLGTLTFTVSVQQQ